MEIRYREMTVDDIPAVIALWELTDEMTLGAADSPESLSRYLKRNPGLSSVAETPGREIVGALLCGHDGRRAHLNHLAVRANERRRGVGRRLVTRSVDLLEQEQIGLVYLAIHRGNDLAERFWASMGWRGYDEVFPGVALWCRRHSYE